MLNKVRTTKGIPARFHFALKNQSSFRIIPCFHSEVFNLRMIVISYVIKPKTIFAQINDSTQRRLQGFALTCIQQTLKNGTLHPLSVLDTFLRNAPKALLSRIIRRIYIIGHQNQQFRHTSFPQKRRVRIQVTAHIARQQQRLNVWH